MLLAIGSRLAYQMRLDFSDVACINALSQQRAFKQQLPKMQEVIQQDQSMGRVGADSAQSI
jgi:hypothetical protein